MANSNETQTAVSGVVVINDSNGHSVVERNSSLKRLHYFDGKFLRAPDLQLEQNALLNQVRISNQAGGSGIVHGLSCLLKDNDTLQINAGLAFDSQGRVLQLGNNVDVAISELIARTAAAATSDCQCADSLFGDCEQPATSSEADNVLEGETLYLISLHYIEAYCGEEDVYGQLCETACAGSTQRPYILPGVEIRAVPLTLDNLKQSALITSKHLRSRVASAYFALEVEQQPSSLISKQGLASEFWCLSAQAAGGNGVAVAVIGRSANQTLFVDAWTARRERMTAPPRHYWAKRMAMRSWQVFMAQVLQFQCQLLACPGSGSGSDAVDPCADEKQALSNAAAEMQAVIQQLQLATTDAAALTASIDFASLQSSYQQLLLAATPSTTDSTRYLIDCGIVELPSAGYLPVDSLSSVSVNDQVQRIMGEGVDLRFCVVRPDFIPHALEEAQHMQRICLLEGIEDPDNKPRVDILVPDGRIETYAAETAGTAYEMEIYGSNNEAVRAMSPALYTTASNSYAKQSSYAYRTQGFSLAELMSRATQSSDDEQTDDQQGLQGAARGETLDSGGYAFYFAGRMPPIVKSLVQFSATSLAQYSKAKPVSTNSENIQNHDGVWAAAAPSSDTSEVPGELSYDGAQSTVTAADDSVSVQSSRLSDEHTDLWLSLYCDRDPFTLTRGASCTVSFEVTALIGAEVNDQTAALVIELSQQGMLVINEVLAPTPESILRATLSTHGVISVTTSSDDQQETKSQSMRIDEQVYLQRDAGSALGFTISIPELKFFDQWDTDTQDFDLGLNFERSWTSANEAQFSLELTYFAEQREGKETESVSGEIDLLYGRQLVNAEVLKTEHPLHETSLVALAEIGQALQNTAYADSRSRLLFPPPLPTPDLLRVFAQHDWVLFHRRRNKQCEYQPVAASVTEPREYRLLLVDSLTSRDELLSYTEALQNNQGDVILRVGYQDAGSVEFEAGLQTVSSNHSSLESNWDMLVNSDKSTLMLGVIASRGAAYDEGSTLAELRLRRASEILSPVTPLDEEGDLLHLDKIPDVLAEGDKDGVIIMVVAEAQSSLETVCHEVYAIQLDDTQLQRMAVALPNNFDAAMKEYGGQQLSTKALFEDTTDNFQVESRKQLQEEWLTQQLDKPYHGLVVTRAGADGNIPDDQPYTAQLNQVVEAVDGAINTKLPIEIADPEFNNDCVAVSILVYNTPVPVETVCHEVYGLALDDSQIKELQEMLQRDAAGTLKQLIEGKLQSSVLFYDADPNLLDDSKESLTQEWLELGAGIPYYSLLVVNPDPANGGVPEDQPYQAQLGSIMSAVGANDSQDLQSVIVTDTFDSDCVAASILIVQPQQLSLAHANYMMAADTTASSDNSGTETSTVALSKQITFDEQGTLVTNEALDLAVNQLKTEEARIKTLEVVTTQSSNTADEQAKAEQLLERLKQEGIAEASATVEMRSATEDEKLQMMGINQKLSGGFVLRAVAAGHDPME